MAEVVIRPAVTSDLDALLDLLELLFSIEEDFVFNEERARRGLAMIVAGEGSVVLVAESAGHVVGMSSGQITISTAEGGPALLVEDVVVQEPWQGMGLGRRLVMGLEEWARTKNIGRLQLLADRNNGSGLEFYKALGWQTTELICLRKRV